ncbi:hypothetical protein DFH27DRAFT_527179 [Peziza echinospora]|nr:hypothetical protein DFH27DRAFT_527179 [Peziza echinospora]
MQTTAQCAAPAFGLCLLQYLAAAGFAPAPLPGSPANKAFRNPTETPGATARWAKPRALQKRAEVARAYQPGNMALIANRPDAGNRCTCGWCQAREGCRGQGEEDASCLV